MKNFKYVMVAILLLGLPFVLTSCEDILGHWEKPTPPTTLFDPYSTPLTFEAKVAGAQVTFNLDACVTGTVQYSLDGNTWINYDNGTAITLSNVGDKVSFRGNNSKYSIQFSYSNFVCSEECYLFGNIMSLLSINDFPEKKELSEDYTFSCLFDHNSNILNHSEKKFVLPAETLSKGCYSGMFHDCQGLTEAPALPAMTLSDYCYYNMFGATSLQIPPKLPALTLAERCYSDMFWAGNLIEAPELPATTLAESCYSGMFSGCDFLVPPELPATNLEKECYREMFAGCSKLQVAPNLPATTLAVGCYDHMFSKCDILATPILAAPVLVENCYRGMFYDCFHLSKIICYAVDLSAPQCIRGWLWPDEAAGTPEFHVSSSYTDTEIATANTLNSDDTVPTDVIILGGWKKGNDGIPKNWIIKK